MSVTVHGASDDLIEVAGDVLEEFTYREPDEDDATGNVLAFSDGTVLRISYSATGVWRIAPVAQGSAPLRIEHADEGDDENYSDRATLDGEIRWVVHGEVCALSKKVLIHRGTRA